MSAVGSSDELHRFEGYIREAWSGLGDARRIVGIAELSAMVSTNHVYRLELDDHTAVIAKVSSYGSYFLFTEDHDRLHRLNLLLRGTRFEHLLADTMSVPGHDKLYTYYNGEVWAVFYDEVERRDRLPRVLNDGQVANLAEEIAGFHRQCAELAPNIPTTSTSIKSDAIALYDQLNHVHAPEQFELEPTDIAVLRRHVHHFLVQLGELDYDDMAKIPVLLDWNLGNFSVDTDPVSGRFSLFSRWDYDWFRIDTRMLDFYFLSRVSSQTGDRTAFTYGSHTLLEPRFVHFLRSYHAVFALSENEVLFLKESYRFFILNYVIRSGGHFFRVDFWRRFQREAVMNYLPELDTVDLRPLVDAVLG